MSVYTVAVTLALLVPSLNLIFYDVDLYFIVLGSALVFINTTVLCLVFFPKVINIHCHLEVNICDKFITQIQSIGQASNSEQVLGLVAYIYIFRAKLNANLPPQHGCWVKVVYFTFSSRWD